MNTKVTPLRQKMIDELTLRGYSPRTHESYLYAISKIAAYYHRSPDTLTVDEMQKWLLHLLNKQGLSNSSCRLYVNALRFLFVNVLKREPLGVVITYPKLEQRIPELLSRKEVAAILMACPNAKHRMMLSTCYGCGLRVSELVGLKVKDIDGERQLLRVTQGKGAKDRLVTMSPELLRQLRAYWNNYRPPSWLFPNATTPSQHLTPTTPQKAFTRAKREVGIKKIGGIHSLRHAYATHQLESGLSVHKLKQLLGHKDIHSTMRYIHWIPNDYNGQIPEVDLLKQLEVNHESL